MESAAAPLTAAAEAAGTYLPPPPPPPTAAAAAAAATPPVNPSPVAAATPPPPAAGEAVGPLALAVVSGGGSSTGGMTKKKRGRPRKYGPDGSVLMPMNPRPISASTAGQYPLTEAVLKRARGRPGAYAKKQHRIDFQSSGAAEMVSCSAGANFTPHIITVAAGEDVTSKIISFSQQEPRTICILSANGVISNVTLRQPDSSGGTLTYEGRFELLSLSGSFMPTENGGRSSRTGGLSVSLASPDGRVVGGGVAGLLVAASPVQVVVGSFLPSYQMDQKTKKPSIHSASVSTPTAAIPVSRADVDGGTYRSEPVKQHQPVTPKTNGPTFGASSFGGENWVASIRSTPDTNSTDMKVSLPGG